MGHVVSFTRIQTSFLFSDLLMAVLSLEGRSKQLFNKLQGTRHGNCHGGGMKAWPGMGCPTLADKTTAKKDNQLGSSDSTCLHWWALIAGRAFEKGPLISVLQTRKWYIMFQCGVSSVFSLALGSQEPSAAEELCCGVRTACLVVLMVMRARAVLEQPPRPVCQAQCFTICIPCLPPN